MGAKTDRELDPDADLNNKIYEGFRKARLTPQQERELFPIIRDILVAHAGEVQAKKIYEVIARELRALKLN